MKDIPELELWKKAVFVVVIIVIGWLAAVGLCSIIFKLHDRVNQPPRIASEETKRLMKSHGTQYSECDWSGDCYFYRDGKRVKM